MAGSHGRRLHGLIERLEALWVEPADADVDALVALLAERQEVLTAIQNADTTALDPAVRAALLERVGAVRRRDASLLAELAARRTRALKKLDEVVAARSAVRGYRPAPDASDRDPGRVA